MLTTKFKCSPQKRNAFYFFNIFRLRNVNINNCFILKLAPIFQSFCTLWSETLRHCSLAIADCLYKLKFSVKSETYIHAPAVFTIHTELTQILYKLKKKVSSQHSYGTAGAA